MRTLVRPRLLARRRRRPLGGFTLVELMIALVIFSVAVAGMLGVAVTMVNGYRATRLAIAAENAVRVPLDFLADALRQVSPGAATGQIEDTMGAAGACPTSALTVTDGGATGSDRIDMIYAAGAVVTSTRTLYDGALTTLEVTNASALSAGDDIVITDASTGVLARIDSIMGNVLTLEAPTCTLSGTVMPTTGFAAGAIVVRARHASVYIGSIPAIPVAVPALMFDPDADGPLPPEPLAEGVEDLQVAVGVDTTGVSGILEENAVVDGDDWTFNVAGEVLLPAGVPRALRITLVSRTSDATGTAAFQRPRAENRSIGVLDIYRRRVLRTVVELRNFGGSP